MKLRAFASGRRSFEDSTVSLSQYANSRSAERAVKVLTALFVLSLWTAFLLWGFHQHTEDRLAASLLLERQRSAAEAQVNNVFQTAEVFIAAADRWVSDHPGEDPRRSEPFAELIRAFQRVTGSSMLVRLVSERGELFLIPADGQYEALMVDDREYFKEAMAASAPRIVVGAPLQGRATGRWSVPLAMRLSRPAHGLAVICVAVEIERFNRVFDAVRIDGDSVIALARRDGILLARSATQPVDLGVSLAQGAVFAQGLPRAPRGVLTTSASATDGIPRLLAYGAMSTYPLVLIVGDSLAAIDTPLWRAVGTLAAVLLLVTLVVVFSAWRSLSLLAAVRASQQELSRLASTDALTGLINRREFLEVCAEELARARRYRQPLAFLEFDLDFFKRINDAYGHAAGDAVLRAFSGVGGQCLRDVDNFGRLGGEEFGMLLPNTDAEGAVRLGERLVAATAACEVKTGELVLRFTTSVGITELGAEDSTFDSVYARADRALYHAKAAGRNGLRTCLPERAPDASPARPQE